MTSVAIFGAGIGGLTAAQELIDRGYAVTMYEATAEVGGKARSQPVPGTATGGRRPLPGEHGFRFYPRFYRHVIDTMSRIASPLGGSVADQLRATTETAIANIDNDTWHRFARKRLDNPMELIEALELFFQGLDFDAADAALFGAKFLQFATSCEARRQGAYEHTTWYEFVQGDAYSPAFRRQLRALPRTLVAMDPLSGSANTFGTITIQLLLDYATSGVSNDRTLSGPTSEIWLDPWISQLQARGVTLVTNAAVTAIHMAGSHIDRVDVSGQPGPITADYYVLALPIDKVIPLVTPDMGAVDGNLEALRHASVSDMVSWMSGIQYYLYEDVPLVRGHVYFADAPWGLTCISQAQFWRDHGLLRTRYGDGTVGGIISVDVCNWDTPGLGTPKTAKQCTPAEFAAEIWLQLKRSLNGNGPDDQVLTDALLHSYHLDDDLDYGAGLPPQNRSPLLVHPPGHWRLRPDAGTAIPNLMVAADYVRTFTNLASMEGACEAGRRACNAILDRQVDAAARAEVWALTEHPLFDIGKRLDAVLYQRGQPHLFELMGIRHAKPAMELLRTLRLYSGLEALDAFLDQFKLTSVIEGLLGRLGVHLERP